MSSNPIVKNSPAASDPPRAELGDTAPIVVPPGVDFSRTFSLQGILDRTRTMRGLLRLKPFDTATEQGRSHERYRRAALTTLTSVLARVVTVLTSLITVRLTIRYLGTERYGLWMTISSVVTMLVFADLGIGNGLLNVIADAHGRDDKESKRRYVSSAFFILLGIAAFLMAVFAIAYPFVPWPRVFNVSTPLAMHEAGPAVAVFMVCFLLNIPLDVVQRVQTGHQEGFATNFWTVVGSLLSLGALLVVIHLRAGLPLLLLAISGGQLLGILGNWAQVFGIRHPELFPNWHYWNYAAARGIMNTGIIFLTLQACSIFAIPFDNIIISQILGPAAVTQYAVPMRLFLLVNMVATMVLAPLWPAYGEALARGDLKWVRSTFYRSLGYSTLVFAPVCLGVAGLGKQLVHIWVGPQVQPTYLLLFGMAAWIIITVLGAAMGVFLCGINVLKLQIAVALSTAIANIVLKLVMAKAFGLPGVIWAMVMAALLATVLTIVLSLRNPTVVKILREG